MEKENQSILASYFSNEKELETVLQLFDAKFLENMLKDVKPNGMESVIRLLVNESKARMKTTKEEYFAGISSVQEFEEKISRKVEELCDINQQLAWSDAQFSPEGFVKFYEERGLKLSGVDDDQDYIDLGPLWNL